MIYLIGFMGTGKTSTGKELSKLFNEKLLDTDELIVKEQKKTIPEIFDEAGEKGFREIETGVFKNLSEKNDSCVISCGGGAPLNPVNVSYMKKNGTVVRLTATASTVYDRVKDDTGRPLLRSEDPMKRITELMSEREGAYSKAADLTIETDGKTPEQVALQIYKTLTKQE